MTIELDLIYCESITIPADYPRENPAQSNITDILDSFSDDHGIINPVVVFRTQEGAHILLKGSRRIKAALIAGFQNIPALIFSKIPYSTALDYRALLHLSLNLLSPFEISKTIDDLEKTKGIKGKQLSALVGWGDNDVGRVKVGYYLRIMKFPPEVCELFKGENPLSINYALQLQRLLPFPDYMAWLGEKIVSEGLTPTETHQIINQIENLSLNPDTPLDVGHEIKKRTKMDFSEFSKIEHSFLYRYGSKLKIKKLTSGDISVNIKVSNAQQLDAILRILDL